VQYAARVSLRDRKRERTRRAIVEAAADLFERHGYEETTVADIAAAAEIGTRTFFTYFPTKEDVLFPDSAARVQGALDAIAAREPGERPAEVLLRALKHLSGPRTDMVGRLAVLRTRLTREVPAVRGKGLQVQLEAHREIARRLHAAYPSELDEVSAAALVGAFLGAITGALMVLLDDSRTLADEAHISDGINRATRIALRPWMEA
jgi:AcrR family transcriptional regulator